MLAKLKAHWKKVLVGLFTSVLLGVAVLDTYPTYFKTLVTLSPLECSQVATIVAASAFRKQAPNETLPNAVVAELKDATRLSKRVAKYIMDKNPDITGMPPMFLYVNILEGCLMSEGVADLK